MIDMKMAENYQLINELQDRGLVIVAFGISDVYSFAEQAQALQDLRKEPNIYYENQQAIADMTFGEAQTILDEVRDALEERLTREGYDVIESAVNRHFEE